MQIGITTVSQKDLMFILHSLYIINLYIKVVGGERKFSFFSNSPIGTTLLVSLTRSSITKFKSGVLRSGTKVTVQLFAHQSQLCSWGVPFTTNYDGFFFIGYIEVMPCQSAGRGSVATKALALG